MTDLSGTRRGIVERFVFGDMDGVIAVDHLARYHWAAAFAKDRRVLDAACGTAYGSAILAAAGAAEVLGVDMATEVLEHVRDQMPAGVRLAPGLLESLPVRDASIGLLVCLEAIEHVEDAGAVVDEFARALSPDGLLVVSSPNRAVSRGDNPHHVHEFTPGELEELLHRRFQNVALHHQHQWLWSAILGGADFTELMTTGRDVHVRGYSRVRLGREDFVVALAANVDLPSPPPLALLGDNADTFRLRHALDELEGYVERMTADRDRHALAHEELATERARLAEHTAELEREIRELYDVIAEHERSLTWRVSAPLRRLRTKL